MGNIATYVWVDQQYSAPNALNRALGDSFLVHQNRFYMKTRELVVRSGFSFVSNGSELCAAYTAAPLLTLDAIYAHKQIPYHANVHALKGISTDWADVEMDETTFTSFFKRNVHFHESLHCIGQEKMKPWVSALDLADHQTAFVMESAYVEAFANTIERLSFCDAIEPMHLLYLQINSYVGYSTSTVNLLGHLVAHFSREHIFRMVFCTLCILNLRAHEPTRADLAEIANTCCTDRILTTSDIGFFTETAAKCWGLSTQFRTVAANLFYRLHGAETDFKRLSHQATFAPPASIDNMLLAADILFADFREPSQNDA